MPAWAELTTRVCCLNESPSEKEGKCRKSCSVRHLLRASMKVPPKRKGNIYPQRLVLSTQKASMKVPPKRKGNDGAHGFSNLFICMPQ